MTPRPLVIDTDGGVDDALAILLALASPEVELRLVTTVHGNVPLPQATENALRVLHLAGRADVPVAAGAAGPVAHPEPLPPRTGHGHGANGLGGVELPPSPAVPDPRPATVALAELLLASPVPVTVAAIGPLTNLALLLRDHPEAAPRIGRLVVMGGVVARAGTDFNVQRDPEAAAAVLGAGLPTVLVPLDVTLSAPVPDAGVERIPGSGPVGRAAAAMLRPYAAHARATFGVEGVPVHDALALTEAIAPGTLGTARREVAVDTTQGPGRGRTHVGRRVTRDAVEVAAAVDGPAAAEFLVGRLARLDRR